MADRTLKTPRNVPGPFYVDETCIDCDLCRETAPQFFQRDDTEGVTYVWKQPATPEEYALADDALQACPTDTIGSNGGAE
jgi:ferredoxin